MSLCSEETGDRRRPSNCTLPCYGGRHSAWKLGREIIRVASCRLSSICISYWDKALFILWSGLPLPHSNPSASDSQALSLQVYMGTSIFFQRGGISFYVVIVIVGGSCSHCFETGYCVVSAGLKLTAVLLPQLPGGLETPVCVITPGF